LEETYKKTLNALNR